MKNKKTLYEIQRTIKNINRKDKKPIDNQNLGNYIRIIHYYATYSYPYAHDTETTFDTFKLPDKITYEDFFKRISYYSDKIDERIGCVCSVKSAKYLNSILPLLGCTKEPVEVSNVFPVYICNGLIRKDDSFPKYYEWYTKNVSIEEIKMLYTKYGINFYDILEQNDLQEVSNNKTRTLKK